MTKKLLMMCSANYPNYGEDMTAKGVLWMGEFQKYQDDLMETAIRSCMSFCKKFPTISDIKDAIKDLAYDEQTKPKQLPWDVKRDFSIAAKAVKFVHDGKAAEYMASVDITGLHQYAKTQFPEISAELVRKNYSEVIAGYESILACGACRGGKSQCVTGGYVTKLRMTPNGYMNIEMQACQKNTY